MAKRLAVLLVSLFIVGGIPAISAEAATAPVCGTDPSTPHLVHGTISFRADLDCFGFAGLKLDGPATIKLNGHTFSSTTDVGPAVDDSNGFPLKLLGPGTIKNWSYAVVSTGRTQIEKLTFDTVPSGAISITANKAQVDRNTFKNIAGGAADYLVTITGDKAKVRHNQMTGDGVSVADISITGNKALVSGNRLDALALDAEAILVQGDREKVIRNVINATGGNGIHVGGTRIQVKKNTTTFNLKNGVLIDGNSSKVLVTRNIITDNQNYGVADGLIVNPGSVKHNTFARNAHNCNFTPCS